MAFISLKRALLAGGTAVILGGAALGVTHAQTATPTTPPANGTPQAGKPAERMQAYLDALAKRLGVSTDKLKQAMADARKDAGLPEPGKGHRPGGPGALGAPGRPGGSGRPGFPPGGPGAGLRVAADAAAKAIGISTDQLRQELPGKSLTNVAKAHNADPAKVADAIKAEANARIDQAVKDNKLTADRAAQMKQRLSDMVDQMMIRTMPQRPAPGIVPGPRDGRGARSSPPGPRPGTTPSAATTKA